MNPFGIRVKPSKPMWKNIDLNSLTIESQSLGSPRISQVNLLGIRNFWKLSEKTVENIHDLPLNPPKNSPGISAGPGLFLLIRLSHANSIQRCKNTCLNHSSLFEVNESIMIPPSLSVGEEVLTL